MFQQERKMFIWIIFSLLNTNCWSENFKADQLEKIPHDPDINHGVGFGEQL